MASVSPQQVWEDPAPGTVIHVPAGELLELGFTVTNDAEKVVTFTASVDGLGPWAPEKTPTLPVVPFESGLLKVGITSAPTAEPGDYPFTIHLFLNGDPVEPNGSVALVMRLLPGIAPVEVVPPVVVEPTPPVVIPEPEVVAPEPTVETPPVVETPVETPAKEKPKKPRTPKEKPVAPVIEPETPEVLAVEPPIEVPPTLEPETVSVDVPPPAPEPEPPTPDPIQEPEPEAPIVEPVPEPEPEPEPEPVVIPPAPEPKPEPAKPTPPPTSGPKLIDLAPPPIAAKPQPEPEPEPEPIPEPIPIPTPVVIPEPVAPRVVDYGQREEETPELEDVAAAYPSDHVFANPKEGTVLYARPGETILVRFNVANDQTGVRTYVLQEDRSLDSDWILLVRDQVNITPGGSGDVAFLLKPPIHAEPASYPFSVSFGILGKPLSNCYLTLTVQAAPAVTVEAKKTSVSVGPLSKRVPFEIQVESAGNSDTAYRLAVMDDSPAPDGTPQEPTPIYETPAWQYLFDKELENLVSPSAGRTPPAVPHRFYLQRKGTWWFGWREKHTVKIAGVPVTDKANNAKPGNVITITGARWRIFPLPMFLMVPLLLITLVLLGSGGDNLRVTNGIQGDDGAFYVVGTEPNQSEMPVRLRWSSPIYAMLKMNRLDRGQASSVSIQRESANDKATVQEYGQAQKISYELGSKFFGSNIKTDVRFVPKKTDGMLQIFGASGPLAVLPGQEEVAEDKIKVQTQDVTVEIKEGETKTLTFTNLTGRGRINGQTIVAWTVRQPQGFRISDFLITQGDNQVINPNASVFAKITVDSQNPPLDNEAIWEILTTDGKYQLLRIKLRLPR